MENPQIRPGKVTQAEPIPHVIAYFYNSAQGNGAIQVLTGMGIPSDRLGVTPPEQIEGGQGMILAIGCTDESMMPKVEALCRSYGAEVHRAKC